MKNFLYRRADRKYVVDRIRNRLLAAYGEKSVFCESENILLGLKVGGVSAGLPPLSVQFLKSKLPG